jgi:glycosyltransferase involved in cell wall biosynthesis
VLNVDDNEFSILATGNLSEEKGHIYLIEAISILKQRNIPVKCFIAGQGNLKLELERKINDFGMKNYIKLLGYREDVPALLAGADIFTMPSLSEALPYSLLEAMAAGLPIVASRVGEFLKL